MTEFNKSNNYAIFNERLLCNGIPFDENVYCPTFYTMTHLIVLHNMFSYKLINLDEFLHTWIIFVFLHCSHCLHN